MRNNQGKGPERKNFILGVTNGILYHTAEAFFESNTIIPVFISRLTSIGSLIGLSSSLNSIGWFLPQAITSNFLQPLKFRKHLYIYAAYIRVISLGMLASSIYFLGASHPSLLLIIFFLLFTIYSLGGGLAGVSFMDVVGKTIPQESRGYFFSIRLFFGGILAVSAGFFVKFTLGSMSFPASYSLLFAIGSFFVFVAVLLFTFIEEPPSVLIKEKKPIFQHLKIGPALIKNDTNFRNLLVFRFYFGLWMMSSPFYILFAKHSLSLSDASAGIFLSIQMAGSIVSNLLWGWLSTKEGNKFLLQTISISAFTVPIFVILSSICYSISYVLVIISFFLIGSINSGLFVGYANLLLEISPEETRPTYLGFMNTMITPIAFLPALGGFLADTFSHITLFSLSAFFSLLAFLSAKKLKTKK